MHRHDAAKHDRIDDTDWSYVYFGSYPQTEVTGDDLIPDITEASYDENGDAWVNDTKYRRISAEDTNNRAEYWDDRNVYRYFKWERIKWRVMQNNGSTLFLMADNALDHKAYITYNESGHFYDPVTWEISTLRQWLNSNFYAAAFSNREQELIVEQTLTNEDYNDTEGGNDTRDKVYLLSFAEATNPEYGFCNEYYDKYTRSREMDASDYAHALGAWLPESKENGGTDYWLRSPGNSASKAAFVSYVGYILHDRSVPDDEAVVLALHISKSSNLWYTEDDGTSGDGGDKEFPDDDPGKVTVSCTNTMEIEAGKEKELSLNIHGNTESQLNAWKDMAEIAVSDTSVLTVEKGNFTNVSASMSDGTADAVWLIKIKGLKQGTATIHFKCQGNAAAYCEVTVTPAAEKPTNPPDTDPTVTPPDDPTVTPPETPEIKVKKLSISAISNKIAAGKKVALKVTVSPKNASNPKVEWKTDNKKYATVDSKGVVTTKKAGKSMTLKADVWINGKNANNKLQWTVSNDKYASVNSKGKVTAKKAGKGKTVTVTAMSTDGTNKKAKVKIRIK